MKAFPAYEYQQAYDQMMAVGGMELRDYFAAQVMPAMIANFLSKELDELDPMGWMDGLATDAYTMADAMMKARKL